MQSLSDHRQHTLTFNAIPKNAKYLTNQKTHIPPPAPFHSVLICLFLFDFFLTFSPSESLVLLCAAIPLGITGMIELAVIGLNNLGRSRMNAGVQTTPLDDRVHPESS